MKFTAVVEWRGANWAIDSKDRETVKLTLDAYNEEGFPDVLILPDSNVVYRTGIALSGSEVPQVGYLPALVVRLTDQDEAYRIDMPSVFSVLDQQHALLSRLRTWLSLLRSPSTNMQEEVKAMMAEIDGCIGPFEPRKKAE